MRKLIIAALIGMITLPALADPADAVVSASGTIKMAGCASSTAYSYTKHYKDCAVVLATSEGEKAFKIEDQEVSSEVGRTATVIKYNDGVYHVLLGEKK
jgi:hypothetical protein